jgi:outer membrane protein assembly factor BamB
VRPQAVNSSATRRLTVASGREADRTAGRRRSTVYVTRGTALQIRSTATGALLWSTDFGQWAQLGKPVVARGVVYATVDGTELYPFDAVTGRALHDEHWPLYAGVVGHPVIVNGRLYVTDGRVLDMYSRLTGGSCHPRRSTQPATLAYP